MPEPRITESQHADGWPHARSTVRRMAQLARDAAQSYEIRSLATAIVQDVPSKQTTAELGALYRWVRDYIRYRFDPVGVEWLQSPSRTLEEGAGDCDDIATLLAALAESLGHETRYHVVGPDADTPQHVAVEAWDGTQWVTLDPVLEAPSQSTQPRDDLGEFGRRAEGYMRHFDNRGSQLGSYAHDLELWQWTPLAYTDTGLLVPAHADYAGPHYNYPDAAMPDAVRPAGIVGARFSPSNMSPCVVLPRGMMGEASCTCPMSDRTYGLGFWRKTGLGFNPFKLVDEKIIDPIGDAFKDGFEWAKNAVSDSLSWMKGAYEDALGAMKPVADVALVVASVPGVKEVLGSVIPGGKVITTAVQQWSITVQKLSEQDGLPIDVAGQLAFDEMPPDMKDALQVAPEAMAELQQLDLSVLADAGLDADVLATVEQVRNNIPPDIDFSAIANGGGGFEDRSPVVARAGVAPAPTQTADVAPPEPAQVAPVPSDADPLVQFTTDVLEAAERDPQAASEMIQSGIHFAMSSAFPRQKYDDASRVYRIYAPVLSGLGAAPRRSEDIWELAFNAGMEVAQIIDGTGAPPRVPVDEVAEFQRAVDTPDDGLWGPNTRLAVSYYLEQPLDKIPEVHPAFRDTPTTWQPPEPAPQRDPEPTAARGPTQVTQSVPAEPDDDPEIAPVPQPTPTAAPPPPPPDEEPDVVLDVYGPEYEPVDEPPPETLPEPEPTPEPAPEPSGGYREVGTSPVDPGLPELDSGAVQPRKSGAGANVWALLLAYLTYDAAF